MGGKTTHFTMSDGEILSVSDKKPEVDDMAKKRQSRVARWAELSSSAAEMARELVEFQQEFQDWRDNLPENLETSRTAEMLDEIICIDLESAVSSLEEAESVELPLGFGRD